MIKIWKNSRQSKRSSKPFSWDFIPRKCTRKFISILSGISSSQIQNQRSTDKSSHAFSDSYIDSISIEHFRSHIDIKYFIILTEATYWWNIFV